MDHKKFGAFSKFGSLKLLFKWLKDWAGPAGGLLALLFPPLLSFFKVRAKVRFNPIIQPNSNTHPRVELGCCI